MKKDKRSSDPLEKNFVISDDPLNNIPVEKQKEFIKKIASRAKEAADKKAKDYDKSK